MGISHNNTIDGVEEGLDSSNSDILQLEEKERQFRLNLSEFASEEDHMHLHDLDEFKEHFFEHFEGMEELISQSPHLEYQLQTQFSILQNKHVEFINDVYKKIDAFANDDHHVHLHEWDEYQEHFFEHFVGLEEEFEEHPELMDALKKSFKIIEKKHAEFIKSVYKKIDAFANDDDHVHMHEWHEFEEHFFEHFVGLEEEFEEHPELMDALKKSFKIIEKKHAEFIKSIYKKIDAFANDDDHVHLHEWDEYQEHFFEHFVGLEEEFEEHPELMDALKKSFKIIEKKHAEFIKSVYKKIDAFANDDDHIHMHEWDEYQEHFFEHFVGLKEEFEEHPELMNALKNSFKIIEKKHAEFIKSVYKKIDAFANDDDHIHMHEWHEFEEHFFEHYPHLKEEFEEHPELMNALKKSFKIIEKKHAEFIKDVFDKINAYKQNNNLFSYSSLMDYLEDFFSLYPNLREEFEEHKELFLQLKSDFKEIEKQENQLLSKFELDLSKFGNTIENKNLDINSFKIEFFKNHLEYKKYIDSDLKFSKVIDISYKNYFDKNKNNEDKEEENKPEENINKNNEVKEKIKKTDNSKEKKEILSETKDNKKDKKLDIYLKDNNVENKVIEKITSTNEPIKIITTEKKKDKNVIDAKINVKDKKEEKNSKELKDPKENNSEAIDEIDNIDQESFMFNMLKKVNSNLDIKKFMSKFSKEEMVRAEERFSIIQNHYVFNEILTSSNSLEKNIIPFVFALFSKIDIQSFNNFYSSLLSKNLNKEEIFQYLHNDIGINEKINYTSRYYPKSFELFNNAINYFGINLEKEEQLNENLKQEEDKIDEVIVTEDIHESEIDEVNEIIIDEEDAIEENKEIELEENDLEQDESEEIIINEYIDTEETNEFEIDEEQMEMEEKDNELFNEEIIEDDLKIPVEGIEEETEDIDAESETNEIKDEDNIDEYFEDIDISEDEKEEIINMINHPEDMELIMDDKKIKLLYEGLFNDLPEDKLLVLVRKSLNIKCIRQTIKSINLLKDQLIDEQILPLFLMFKFLYNISKEISVEEYLRFFTKFISSYLSIDIKFSIEGDINLKILNLIHSYGLFNDLIKVLESIDNKQELNNFNFKLSKINKYLEITKTELEFKISYGKKSKTKNFEILLATGEYVKSV